MDCPICNTTMRQREPWLAQCPKCRFESSTLKPGAGRGVDGLESLRRENFKNLIHRLKTHKDLQSAICLEVGPAEGWFLEAMKHETTNIHAIEASEQALDLQKNHSNITHGFFPDVLKNNEQYDVIIFNDVFEHLPCPIDAIKSCEKHLNKDGLLILNLPNSRGVFYKISGVLKTLNVSKPFERLWQKNLPSPHITYFSDKNIKPFVTKHTALKNVENFYLQSISKDGLKSRVESSYKGTVGQCVYFALLLVLPFLKLLPQDIMVFIFKKSS